jgi:hypothetical protein
MKQTNNDKIKNLRFFFIYNNLVPYVGRLMNAKAVFRMGKIVYSYKGSRKRNINIIKIYNVKNIFLSLHYKGAVIFDKSE